MCGCKTKISGVMKNSSSKLDFKSIGLRVVGVSAGAVAAGFAVKIAPALDPKIKAAGIMAIGVGLPLFIKGQKFIEHVGDGMIAQGANMLVGSLFPNLISGDDDFVSGDMMSDETYTETITGADDDGYNVNTSDMVNGFDISGADDDEAMAY